MHEHLFVFRKPKAGEDLARLRYSRAIDDPSTPLGTSFRLPIAD
jgi:hypothetical protein